MTVGVLLAVALLAPKVSPEARSIPVEVHADSLEYRYKERRTVMTGNPLVTLTRGDATLVCRRLVAELDPAGQIDVASCEGDVKLTRGERVVTCASARFESRTGRLTCQGDPELRDGASVVRGELLVYDLDEDRVTLTRARGTVVQRPGDGAGTGLSPVEARPPAGAGKGGAGTAPAAAPAGTAPAGTAPAGTAPAGTAPAGSAPRSAQR